MINKVTLLGVLGRDPEVRHAANGNAVANLSVATSETWNDKTTGERQEKTEWHRVVVFGKLAEIAERYLVKGSQVYLEGKLQTRKWQADDGSDRYTTEVVLDYNGVMKMLGGKKGGNTGGGQEQAGGYAQPQVQRPAQGGYQQQAPAQRPAQGGYQQQAPAQAAAGYKVDDFDMEDDVPF